MEDELAQLRAENAALRQQVAELTRRLAAALDRIADLEAQLNQRPPSASPPVKAATAPRPSKARKKRPPHHNHGRRCSPPTRVVQHALERCPDCHYRLRGSSIARRRQVIDLPPPPPVEVVEHQVIQRFCPHCSRWQTPRLDLRGQVVGPQGRLGVRLGALIAYLRTTLRVPIRQIQHYLATVHHLRLSAGGIVELLHRVRQTAAPALDALQAEARASPVLYLDETGWRENGQNGYLWTVSTPRLRYVAFDRSRAGAVVRRLLGGQLDGHLVSDFYAAYNWYPGPQQRCWAHLLRDLQALAETHPTDMSVQGWVAAVRELYARARRLVPGEHVELHYALLVSETHTLGQQYAQQNGHPCWALAKRLLRHEAELFQFVLVPELEATNNLAERSLRPHVIARKISGGTRSPAGTQTRLHLASLFATWQLREQNPFAACLALLSGQTPLLGV